MLQKTNMNYSYEFNVTYFNKQKLLVSSFKA